MFVVGLFLQSVLVGLFVDRLGLVDRLGVGEAHGAGVAADYGQCGARLKTAQEKRFYIKIQFKIDKENALGQVSVTDLRRFFLRVPRHLKTFF